MVGQDTRCCVYGVHHFAYGDTLEVHHFAYCDTLEVHHFAYCDTLEVLVFAGCDLGAGLVLQNVTPEAWVSTIKTRASTWMVAPTVLTHPKNLQKFAVGKSHEFGAAGCRLDARRRRAQ